MTERRVRDKKEVFMYNPRQGRMVVQLYKPPATNAKHAHPKLEGGESCRRQRLVEGDSRLAYRHSSPS